MEVEWIILADGAEAVNNKLYLIGGGWETLTVSAELPLLYPCAVAVAFSVPWNETNQRHSVEIAIEDGDGTELARVPGQIEVGKPPGIPLGTAQRVHMAIKVALPLRQVGTHYVIARIEGQEIRREPFNVITGSIVSVPHASSDAA